MTAEILRRAATLMRERATEAGKPENSHPYGDTMYPPAVTATQYSTLMRDYLDGPWGEQAASWHPAVAVAVADWLDNQARRYETAAAMWNQATPDRLSELAGNGLTPEANLAYVFKDALAVARAYLGDDQ